MGAEQLDGASLVDHLREQTPAMVAAVDRLVSIESPSADAAATRACGDAFVALVAEVLGAEHRPVETVVEGRRHLHWQWGSGPSQVVLVGHLDTVWPLGTLARWPFSVDGDHATGPGCFDMKAGLVQGLYALATLDDLDGITLIATVDEELGSPTSADLIGELVRGAKAALVLEPSAAGALKVARKGIALYDIDITGRAAHAGLEPENGANALIELAHQIAAVEHLGDTETGTTVTPTTAAAGTTMNTVPAGATFHLDVRVPTQAEADRVDAAVRALRPTVAGASLDVRGGLNRPPFPESASAGLFELANDVAASLGLKPLDGVAVGGGSDGNFTAGLGVATLDGLGAVGDGAHAEGEHVLISAMAERAAVVAGLLQRLR